MREKNRLKSSIHCRTLLVLVVFALFPWRVAAQDRPNVILIMTDDQGYGDIGSHGNPVLKTPNLDKLASQSVRLDDYHASPYCVPSRATLLTGRYADRTGIHNHLEPHWFVRSDETMLSNMFRDAGYATGMFGKWHLGDNYPYRPEDRGFEEVLRHNGGAVGTLADYWDNCYVDDTYCRNGKPAKAEGYCTDVFFGAATRFIETCAGQKKPFFLYLATNAPHGPQICPPSYNEPYANGASKKAQKFFGMIANIDENVGKLRAFLEENGLAENTVFIFTTDNGSAGGSGVFNAGMKGKKMSPYDGGHRVPFFLHWPEGGFAKERRIKTLTAQIDIAPTLLDLCGIAKPAGVRFDGVSLRPLLETGDHEDWASRMIMTDAQYSGPPEKWVQTAVMTERWRLVDGKELYDIDADPGQENDIRDKHPEIVKQLTKHYDTLWDEFQPAFNKVAEIPLTAPGEKTVALNYHDCIGRHMFWFQNGIRSLNQGRFRGKPVKLVDSAEKASERAPAYWPVKVVADGEYRFELRRWPVELDRPIHADLPPGAPVYGEEAQRSVPGMRFAAVKATLTIGDQSLTTDVDAETKAAVFKTTLSAGSHRLSARFYDAEGRSLDVFYVYASKIDGHSEVRSAPKIANPIEEESDGITCYHDFQGLEANEFSFDPIVTKFVRIVIHDSIRSRPPCIDELEIFKPGATGNLAVKYGLPSASSSLEGNPSHRIEHLNDGRYGNSQSWICGEKTGWCQIELTKRIKIDRVVLSRDRDGRLEDRSPLSFDIQVSMNGEDWKIVKEIRPTNGTSAKNSRTKRSRSIAYTNTFDPAALRRALDDLASTAPDRFSDAAELRQQIDACEAGWPALLAKAQQGDAAAIKEADSLLALRREILLRNPLLDFEKVLLVKRNAKKDGLPVNFHGLSYITGGPTGIVNEIAIMDLKTGALSTLYRPDRDVYVGEVDLHFDGKKLMFSQPDKDDTWQIHEINTDGSGLRQITESKPELNDLDNYDSVYLPDGRIIFGSTSGFAGVPCHGGRGDVANLHLMNADGSGVRRLTFEQDHDWYPVVLANGRVMYLRWEYADSAHYFSRIMMTMNPDGTGQVEHYGSNSYWPNAMFYARPLPGSSSKFAAIVTGHHGVRRAGRLVLFDAAKGRHETSGVIQQIPGHGKEVPAPIKDKLVNGVWPLFLHPYPLSEKYFLVSCQPTAGSEWGLYLVDVHDNMLPLKEIPGQLLYEPIPLRKTETPRVIPDKVNLESKTATCFIQNIYDGKGLQGVPRGTVKSLRVYNYDYGYRMMGGHYLIGMESGWDVKRLLGTVPVHEDGSAFFTVPANLPIAIQPLDENGRALQLMRSWLVGMPGENVQCVGCHENQNRTVAARKAIALTKPPSDIQPWYGPARGFSFIRDVQPVLNRHCIGCHDGKKENRPDFANIEREGADKQLSGYPHSYIDLHPYVRRNGPEGDYHLLTPLEFHAGTSKLVQMLEKGHHGVKLDAEAWDRINTWIDLNAPCYGTWSEVRPVPENYIERRREMEKLYANVDIRLETLHHKADYDETYVAPKKKSKTKAKEIQLSGWPIAAGQAKAMQAAAGGTSSLDLGNGLAIELARIPAGEFVMGSNAGAVDEQPVKKVKIGKPFWMGTMEVSLEQYLQFNPEHRNRVYDMHYKDQVKPGYDMDKSELPAIRMSWEEAMAFCEWLSEETGRKVTLPTEAQWEWACRAGTATPLSYGTLDTDFSPYANLADASISLLAVKGVDPQPIKDPDQYWDFELKDARFDDGTLHLDKIASREPNAWGLRNMHGNVAEWTRSAYLPYTGTDADGREDAGRRVVRGGSWYDRPKRATSSFRLAYPQWQRVFNTGFRVVVEEE